MLAIGTLLVAGGALLIFVSLREGAGLWIFAAPPGWVILAITGAGIALTATALVRR
jgi:hypothetical protein